MNLDTPLTIPEILTYAPIYDTCIRDVVEHLPTELCDQFSRDVPYNTLADLVIVNQLTNSVLISLVYYLSSNTGYPIILLDDYTIPPSSELDQHFATSILNLYHYVVEVAQHYSSTSSLESQPISPETYCFLIDFWQESQLSFYDLSKLVMEGRDLHPKNEQLEQRINSLFSLVLADEDRKN